MVDRKIFRYGKDGTTWMQTYTNKRVYPLELKIEDIDINDIAHSLSLQCRFNGHCRRFYSVAEHSILVSDLISDEYGIECKFAALLHDAAEAYIGDIIRPVKQQLRVGSIEKRIEELVYKKFGVSVESEMMEAIKMADNAAVIGEGKILFGAEATNDWNISKVNYSDCMRIRHLHCYKPKDAEVMFMAKFRGFIGVIG